MLYLFSVWESYGDSSGDSEETENRRYNIHKELYIE